MYTRVVSANAVSCAGDRGDIVALNGSEKLEGDLGLLRVGAGWVAIRQIAISPMVYKCAESGADIRLLGVPPQADGSRGRLAWREVVPLLVENTVPGWLLDGRRTVLLCSLIASCRIIWRSCRC